MYQLLRGLTLWKWSVSFRERGFHSFCVAGAIDPAMAYIETDWNCCKKLSISVGGDRKKLRRFVPYGPPARSINCILSLFGFRGAFVFLGSVAEFVAITCLSREEHKLRGRRGSGIGFLRWFDLSCFGGCFRLRFFSFFF